jgi:spermidine synthase
MTRTPFLAGVFLIALSSLMFQIVQTRILSVQAWYYMAFFAISVAMLGMTVGAVWVYLRQDKFETVPLPRTLSNFSLLAAIAMPASAAIQYSLITVPTSSLTTVISWSLMLAAMATPYVFAGVVMSLALTRSPFPAGSVYGCDLVGAALGCLVVMGVLNIVDGPTAIIIAGAICGFSALAFNASIPSDRRRSGAQGSSLRRPAVVIACLVVLALINHFVPALRFRPIVVKDHIEGTETGTFEEWNSYSRIKVWPSGMSAPSLWGPSPALPSDLKVPSALMNIDGSAGTVMFHYDGTLDSIRFLQYDIVNLAYRLPDIHKSAVIGVGSGRDILSAHLFGVADLTGIELNPIFIRLDTRDPYFKSFSNLTLVPNLKLHVDDARSWFASTRERFDLIQMSMIDTWAATGAGAFSLSENGLYTLEGWRAFLHALNDDGIFTVSRWYNSRNTNEVGRMIGLGTAALLDAGDADPRSHIFLATSDHIGTLVLSKAPFTEEQIRILSDAAQKLGFKVLLSPDRSSESALLQRVVECHDIASLNRALGAGYLDLTVSTDRRPFFFNQMRLFDKHVFTIFALFIEGKLGNGVIAGNLIASATLVLILFISIVAVIATILFPLRNAISSYPRRLVMRGSVYFSLIGMGFMLAEIALLQYFSIYLGHPIYSLGICLFGLILASGVGSLASESWRINTGRRLALWAAAIAAYLIVINSTLPFVFQYTTGLERLARIAISLALILPLGFLLGFAFPTGMRLVSRIDAGPAPWFWGINGATGVLASVLGVMISMSFGIDVSIYVSAACYLALIPTGFALLKMVHEAEAWTPLEIGSMEE